MFRCRTIDFAFFLPEDRVLITFVGEVELLVGVVTRRLMANLLRELGNLLARHGSKEHPSPDEVGIRHLRALANRPVAGAKPQTPRPSPLALYQSQGGFLVATVNLRFTPEGVLVLTFGEEGANRSVLGLTLEDAHRVLDILFNLANSSGWGLEQTIPWLHETYSPKDYSSASVTVN